MKVKWGAWGVVIGIVISMIVGFSWLGWTLGSTAKRMATEAADSARTEVWASFCVKAAQAPAESKKLADLKAITSSYERSDAVAAAGWATFDGSLEPNRNVAEACATALLKPAGKQALGK